MSAIKQIVDAAQPPALGPIETTNEKGKPLPQATVLVEIGKRHHLFHDAGGDAYARVAMGGSASVYAIDSGDYREILGHTYYRLQQHGCNRNAIADAINTLMASAKFDGPEHRVWLRVGETGDGIEIDTGNAGWNGVEVTASGWKYADKHTLFMRRSGKPTPLPVASKHQDFAKLWRYVNVAEADRVLVAGWLLGALRPRGPCPILLLVGEQGSGKSVTARILKQLTDPSAVNLRSPPADDVDLMVAARSSWVVALDNLSGVDAQLSDALCRMVTGGGFARRTLYTTADETLIEIQRPVIINGIDDIAGRPDLAERCVHIATPPIADRKTEADLEADFERDSRDIFAAILNGLSRAIRDHAKVKIDRLPRMADFAKWAAAGVPALGFTAEQFLDRYNRNQLNAVELGLESSVVAAAIRQLAARGPYEGAATALLEDLGRIAGDDAQRQRAWPRSTKALRNTLRRLAPGLRQVGISITGRRNGGTGARLIGIACKVASQASQVSHRHTPKPTLPKPEPGQDVTDSHVVTVATPPCTTPASWIDTMKSAAIKEVEHDY